MKAVLCPVCRGDGCEWEHTDVERGEPDKIWMKFCHGCNGKGWVEVGNADDRLEPTDNMRYSQPPNWSRCPVCGNGRNSPATTCCPLGGHYGVYI